MNHSRVRSATDKRPYLLTALALIAFMGSAVVIIGKFVAQTLVSNCNWVSDTISDLAAGEWAIVMDVALYGFAASLLAISLASAMRISVKSAGRPGSWCSPYLLRWSSLLAPATNMAMATTRVS